MGCFEPVLAALLFVAGILALLIIADRVIEGRPK